MFFMFLRQGLKDMEIDLVGFGGAGLMALDFGLGFAQLTRGFCHHLIDRGIHVIGLRLGLNDDVIAAMQDHLGCVAVFFDIQDHMGIENTRKIETDVFNFLAGLLLDRFGDADMPSRHVDL